MAMLSNNVYDQGLNYLDTNGTRMDICSSEPANYAGIAAVSVGFKTSLNIGAPEAGTGSGRMVTVPAITDGEVTVTTTAAYYAISNGSSELLATGPLAASQAVTDGNPWTTPAFTIRIPAPA